MEVLPEERDRKYYADNYSCCPPPLFVIFVTLVEVSTYYILCSYAMIMSGYCRLISMFHLKLFILFEKNKTNIYRVVISAIIHLI